MPDDDPHYEGRAEFDSQPLHLDHGGRPLCGRDPAGELVVDQPVHVTCSMCLLGIGDRLRAAAGRAS